MCLGQLHYIAPAESSTVPDPSGAWLLFNPSISLPQSGLFTKTSTEVLSMTILLSRNYDWQRWGVFVFASMLEWKVCHLNNHFDWLMMCTMYYLTHNFRIILYRILMSSAVGGKRNRINVISIPWTLGTLWKSLRGWKNESRFPVALVTSWVWAFWLPPQCLLWAFHYNTATTWDSTRLLMKSKQGTPINYSTIVSLPTFTKTRLWCSSEQLAP